MFIDAYNVKESEWMELYEVYFKKIQRETGLSKEQLDKVVEVFCDLEILPAKYGCY